MVEKWMPLKEAAEHLEVSLRTIQRRIRDGAYETRRNGLGRREVRIQSPPTDQDNVHEALETIQSHTSLLQQAHDAEIARLHVHFNGAKNAARRRLAVAWTVAALLAVTANAAIIWAVRTSVSADDAIATERQAVEDLLVQRDDAVAAGSELQENQAELQRQLAQLAAEHEQLRTERDSLKTLSENLADDLRLTQGEVGRLEGALETLRQSRALAGR